MADRPFNILYGLWAAPSRGSLNDRGRMDMEFEEDDGFFKYTTGMPRTSTRSPGRMPPL